jgi:virulence-associated protein VapD
VQGHGVPALPIKEVGPAQKAALADLRDRLTSAARTTTGTALRDELAKFGFTRQQGSLFYGGAGSSPIQCVLAVQAAAATLPWFKASLADLRMLRIEEDDDLLAAI